MKHPPRRPYIPPVTKIELSEHKTGLRMVLIVLCLIVGGVALGHALTGVLNGESGWQTVEISATERNHSEEITFQYNFGATGAASSEERRQLSSLYTEVMEHAYRIFTVDEAVDTADNLYAVNAAVNQPVKVDPVLYRALEKIVRHNSRYLYLAPINDEYDRVFLSQTEEEAAGYDPTRGGEAGEYVAQLAGFVSDPAHVDLLLMEDSQVQLNVSEEYLAFAQEYEITTFLDLGWMRNAFIVDYVADSAAEKGFTRGYVVSYDGFTRNLDSSGDYSINLFIREGKDLYLPAQMDYDRPISMVIFRDYPVSERDRWHFFAYSDGSFTTAYLDPADGMSKSSIHGLTVYSYEESCADVMLRAAPCFIADQLPEEALARLKESGVFSVWNEGMTVCWNDSERNLMLNEDNGALFTARLSE